MSQVTGIKCDQCGKLDISSEIDTYRPKSGWIQVKVFDEPLISPTYIHFCSYACMLASVETTIKRVLGL